MLTTLPVQQTPPIVTESHSVALREVQPATLIEDVVPQVTPPMAFREWLELVKSYAEAVRRRQDIVDGKDPTDP